MDYRVVIDHKLPIKTAAVPFNLIKNPDAKYATLNNTITVRIKPFFTPDADKIYVDEYTAKTIGSVLKSFKIKNIEPAETANITVEAKRYVTEDELFGILAGIPLAGGEKIEYDDITITINTPARDFVITQDTKIEYTVVQKKAVKIFEDLFEEIEKFIKSTENCPRGIILHGDRGAGKTRVLMEVSKTYPSEVITLGVIKNGMKVPSVIEKTISEASKESKIVIIDDLDVILQFCPRVAAVLSHALDDINTAKIIASVKTPYTINEKLLSPCKFGALLRVRNPSPEEIQKALNINEETAKELHGYTIGDAARLVYYMKATGDNIKKVKQKYPPHTFEKLTMKTVKQYTWNDVGGLEDVKKELKKAVEWPLKYPELFKKTKTTPPKGILLYGPPGTGKTLLAKVVASETGSTFIAVKAPDLLDKYVGETEARIRDIFDRARKNAPAIIFIDEIDAIAVRRGENATKAIDSVINQLLAEMDGINENNRIIVIATTNRPDILDPALLRPGRFEKLIHVPNPDAKARKEIFRIKLREKPVDGVDIEHLARITEGFSGADIEAVIREASYIAIERAIETGGEPLITEDDLAWAIDKIKQMKGM